MATERHDGSRRAAAFDFARQLRSASFRSALTDMGWRSGQHIVPTADDETLADVLARVLFHTVPPAYIAIRRPAESLGFVFVVLVPGPASHAGGEADTTVIGPTTTIGMFYDTLKALHSLPINEWLRAMPVGC